MRVKRNYSLVIALAGLLSFVPDPQIDYSQEFGYEYSNADVLAKKFRPSLLRFAQDFDEDPKVLEAIIFPELIRYNRWYDVFETGSLCGLYANLGADYSNFSIGYFQMKPSFAESVERFLFLQCKESWVKKLGFDQDFSNDDFVQRMARVHRLQDVEWQLRYLIAFVKICKIKFSTELGDGGEDQLRFIATAYNSGWELPSVNIKKRMSAKYFHIGRFNPGKRYAYASIALYRFNQTWSTTPN